MIANISLKIKGEFEGDFPLTRYQKITSLDSNEGGAGGAGGQRPPTTMISLYMVKTLRLRAVRFQG